MNARVGQRLKLNEDAWAFYRVHRVGTSPTEPSPALRFVTQHIEVKRVETPMHVPVGTILKHNFGGLFEVTENGLVQLDEQ